VPFAHSTGPVGSLGDGWVGTGGGAEVVVDVGLGAATPCEVVVDGCGAGRVFAGTVDDDATTGAATGAVVRVCVGFDAGDELAVHAVAVAATAQRAATVAVRRLFMMVLRGYVEDDRPRAWDGP